MMRLLRACLDLCTDPPVSLYYEPDKERAMAGDISYSATLTHVTYTYYLPKFTFWFCSPKASSLQQGQHVAPLAASL